MFLTGSDLLRLRKKAGLSQQKVGDEVGVTRKTVANWEESVGEPSFNQVIKICLACSIDFLFFSKLVVSRKKITTPLNLEQSKKLD